jgi:phosphate transport system substrate-binding protein
VNRRKFRPGSLLAAAIVLGVVTLLATAPAGASSEYAEIEGSGSTWAYGIIAPWIAQVQAAYGMQITFNQSGSSQGRKDFANGVTDFSDSDIPYQGTDPTTGQVDASKRPYAYLPVVSGGTAFTYHITVAGHLVTNLRLSGETITKIFTNKITNWDDPEITKENGGHALPSESIKPVVRSDGSGATAQFTLWMDKEYPSLWRPFNGGKAGLTSIYPRQGNQIAVAQDAGVMNTIKGAGGEGEIGYTEYSYPLQAHYPVVYVENRAHYYVQPNQYNVAVALTQARIIGCKQGGSCSPKGIPPNSYLTQNLDGVYSYKDPRTYPLSSYSYMIIPTSKTDQRMTVPKRQTLADFLSYSLCTGQRLAGPYGYSPLPLNLVKAAFSQLEKLGPKAQGGAVSGVHIKNPSANLASCDNPTFVKGNLAANHLAQIAPMPLACQKATSQPCGDGVVPPGTNNNSGNNNGGNTNTGTTNTGTTNTNTGTTNGTTTGTTTGTTSNDGTGPPGTNTPGSTTGDGTTPVDGTTSNDGTTTTAATTPAATVIPAERRSDNSVWGWTALVEVLAIVLLPGLYVAWLRRAKGTR